MGNAKVEKKGGGCENITGASRYTGYIPFPTILDFSLFYNYTNKKNESLSRCNFTDVAVSKGFSLY